jgi:ACT domain-containing protein
MRISLDLQLKDVPGQLVKALIPISSLGGNIVSVVHMREKGPKGERVPVHVIFEMDNSGRLEKILKALEDRDIWVSKVGEVKKKEEITVILIGHIVDTDVRDTIDKINAIRGAMVADLALAMPHPEKETSARMDIDVADSEIGKKVLQRLDEIAKDKDLVVVKSLGV